MRTGDLDTAFARLSSELAAEALRLALADLEIKFDPNQPRASAGNSNGGQWIDTGRGQASTRVRKPPMISPKPRPKGGGLALRALGFVASNPEAAPAVGAAGLPLLTSGVALNRAMADFDRRTTGREKTPFLNLPTEKLNLRVKSGSRPKASGRGAGRFSPADWARIDEECDELEREDEIKCHTYAAMYGRSKAGQNRIRRICLSTAMERAAECRKNGGFSGVNTPLFMGRY